ncbi:MAG: class I SAM-dependent methyltransferase [Lachnospiraceae bacterium]
MIFTTGNPSFPSRTSVEAAREGFEASFAESDFYNKQTQDEKHLNDILAMINVKPGMRVLDLGCGSGYLTFPIARMNENTCVIGLDIVTDTLRRNAAKAQEMDIKNLEFVTYDGVTFPFEDNSFDLVVTRYALHHFSEIRKSIREVTRVLKRNGIFFVSDPRPNDCDITRFVDDYMQLKKDGHIKFYTKDEWVQICGECNMHLLRSFDSEIRFPRKKSTAEGLEAVLARHEMSIIDSYGLTQTEDEIWVTEQVNNLLFQKNDF